MKSIRSVVECVCVVNTWETTLSIYSSVESGIKISQKSSNAKIQTILCESVMNNYQLLKNTAPMNI